MGGGAPRRASPARHAAGMRAPALSCMRSQNLSGLGLRIVRTAIFFLNFVLLPRSQALLVSRLPAPAKQLGIPLVYRSTASKMLGCVQCRIKSTAFGHGTRVACPRPRDCKSSLRMRADDDIERLERREALVPALYAALGGMVGLAFSKYGASEDKEAIRELVRQDREIMNDVAALRDKLGLRPKAGQSGEVDKESKDAKDDKPKISEEEDNEYELFSVALVGTILTAQITFLAKEYAKIQEYREEGSNFSWSELIQYRLDLFLSRNPLAKGLIILNGAFLVILMGAVLLAIQEHVNIGTALWESWTYVADPGTQANAAEEKPSLRPLALSITVLGLVVFALMVGLVTESVTEQVDSFKKGRSKVLDQDHVIMLGWTDKSLSIIEQLAFANDSIGGTSIVVLGDLDKEDMENELRSAVEGGTVELYNSKVIFRSGDSLKEAELLKMGITRARSIIALSAASLDPDEADGLMLRQALSISGALSKSKRAPPVTLEIQDVDNYNLISLINLNSEIIVTHDIVGQIMVSCSRQPGLAFLLERAISFEGSEFYFSRWPQLYGQKFGALTCRFDDAVVMGIKTKDGELKVNPPVHYVYRAGDELLVIAEDDDSYSPNANGYEGSGAAFAGRERMAQKFLSRRDGGGGTTLEALTQTLTAATGDLVKRGTQSLTRASDRAGRLAGRIMSENAPAKTEEAEEEVFVSSSKKKDKEKDRTLFMGWRRDMADMIQALDLLVEPGSELWLFNSVPVSERIDMLLDKGNKRELELNNLVVKNAVGNPTLRSDLVTLKAMDEFGDETGEVLPLTAFKSTLILADEIYLESSSSVRDDAGDGVKAIGQQNPSDHHALSSDGRSLASFLLVTDVRAEILRRDMLNAAREKAMQQGADEMPTVADLAPVFDEGRERIISEILDATNTKSLLPQLECSGYVLSNRIVSDLIAQVAENPDMHPVLKELLGPTGSSFYLREISDYVDLGEEGPLSFWDVAERARDRNEIAVGFKSVEDSYLSFEIGEAAFTMINPPNKREPRTWNKGDILVTIAYCGTEGQDGVFRGARAWIANEKKDGTQTAVQGGSVTLSRPENTSMTSS